ncbi:hypothetical protein CsSME_00012733 [Camellia sinensis var. sinensis]
MPCGGPSECDGKYHFDDWPIVAPSTGWDKGGSHCLNNITIYDSTIGCDQDHDYQRPCPNSIVDASKAVWKALGISKENARGDSFHSVFYFFNPRVLRNQQDF